ncbi:peptidase M22 [Candidatus Pelagibacter bacterium]|jgi:tRNA A37 threonylcarbamoyladenosine modification protein TsaB|nr:peptidase M22 [Candidatus Pelagibacter bacterium]MDB2527134.1 peptidase M22 [Candidatus Pelagibacter bacterium]MDC0364522.1 peptidase M22 [Candidatus Pelagibacter sp.]MDC0448170.1 peptidase M22 [Candidatus Pelagibacter sp.]|tara:strand:+ start:508 stop:900 length:393 start_codon:yes stop_codon:yes gene_type:complete
MNINNLIIDAAGNEILLTLIVDKNIYTCSHENSKINFEKIMILINNFLQKNKFLLSQISNIYVNRGPGSFAGIRNTLSVIKALYLTKNIDYYCFSVDDFLGLNEIKHQDVPDLCKKFNIKKNLIKPIYLS